MKGKSEKILSYEFWKLEISTELSIEFTKQIYFVLLKEIYLRKITRFLNWKTSLGKTKTRRALCVTITKYPTAGVFWKDQNWKSLTCSNERFMTTKRLNIFETVKPKMLWTCFLRLPIIEANNNAAIKCPCPSISEKKSHRWLKETMQKDQPDCWSSKILLMTYADVISHRIKARKLICCYILKTCSFFLWRF